MDQSKFTSVLSKFFIVRLRLLVSYSVILGSIAFGILYLGDSLFTHYSSSLPLETKHYAQIALIGFTALILASIIKRVAKLYNYFKLLLKMMLSDLVKMADLLQTAQIIDVEKVDDIPDIIKNLKNKDKTKKTVH